MNYYLKYLKYKQKYLDLKNLDLIGGLKLGNYNYNDLEGGVLGIRSETLGYEHTVEDYDTEAISKYWNDKINAVGFSDKRNKLGKFQPGYYLMFYNDDGSRNVNDVIESHIHLLGSDTKKDPSDPTIIRNNIVFNLKLNNFRIDIQYFIQDATKLIKYCNIQKIPKKDMLIMMRILLNNMINTRTSIYNIYQLYDTTDYTVPHPPNNFDIRLDINTGYHATGYPILNQKEKNHTIKILDIYANVCTGLSLYEKFKTGATIPNETDYQNLYQTYVNDHVAVIANDDAKAAGPRPDLADGLKSRTRASPGAGYRAGTGIGAPAPAAAGPRPGSVDRNRFKDRLGSVPGVDTDKDPRFTRDRD